MSHTKGPWDVVGASLIRSVPGMAVIAAVSEPRGSEYVRYQELKLSSPDFYEARDNANLIASAPDLLEACKVAVNALTGHGSIKEEDLEEWAQLALHKCNLAIRKAEGCSKAS